MHRSSMTKMRRPYALMGWCVQTSHLSLGARGGGPSQGRRRTRCQTGFGSIGSLVKHRIPHSATHAQVMACHVNNAVGPSRISPPASRSRRCHGLQKMSSCRGSILDYHPVSHEKGTKADLHQSHALLVHSSGASAS